MAREPGGTEALEENDACCETSLDLDSIFLVARRDRLCLEEFPKKVSSKTFMIAARSRSVDKNYTSDEKRKLRRVLVHGW